MRPSYKDGWDIPSGYVKPNESPAAGCRREVLEEIGLDTHLTRLLVVDWAPHPNEGDKLLFVFDGGVMTDADVAALKLDGDEIVEARFHDPGELPNLTRVGSFVCA